MALALQLPAPMRAALVVLCVWASAAWAQSVSATFETTTKPGQFAPENCVAVWVEDQAGAFVKTIGRWSGAGGPAGDRTIHLVAWRTKAGANDVDAVSGATRLNHQGTLSVQWDLKNKAGAVVPDGTYTLRMEMTEDNSTTAGQNLQGSFTFTKSASAQMQSGLTNNGFVNVSIDYAPMSTPPMNPPPPDPPMTEPSDDVEDLSGGCAAGRSTGGALFMMALAWPIRPSRRSRRSKARR